MEVIETFCYGMGYVGMVCALIGLPVTYYWWRQWEAKNA